MQTPLPTHEKTAFWLWLAGLAALFLGVPSYQRPVAVGVWLIVAVLGGIVLKAVAEGRRR